MNKFKVGDPVRCVDSKDYGLIKYGKAYRVCNFTDIGNISISVGRHVSFYPPQCFELIQEPKYKVVKPFSLLDIFEKGKGRCFHEQFSLLLEEHALYTTEDPFTTWEWIKKFPTLMTNLPWLEEKGFIEKDEVFEPFTLELKIESEAALKLIHSHMHNSTRSASTCLHDQIEKEMHRIKSK